MAEWDLEVDLLVVGSGAAAMSAGIRAHDLGLDVLLIEKGAAYGGSTAMSGGVCWAGNNMHMPKAGVADSDRETLAYLLDITEGATPLAHLETYVRESKRVLEYFAARTHVRFTPLAQYCDYYPERSGGKPGARSLEPDPFDGARLGDDFIHLHRPADSALVLGKFMITARAAKKLIMLGVASALLLAWALVRYGLRHPKRRRFGRDTYLTNGNALVARLRLSLKDRGVPIWLEAPAVDLIESDGRVLGAVIEKGGARVRVRARRGVLLACGGFERNLEMRLEAGRQPVSTEWTAGNEHNTGDGITFGRRVGASTSLMDEAWWTPVTQYPGVKSGWVMVVEKSLPGGIFVNQEGQRFTNEAAPYIDVVVQMYRDHAKTGKSIPAWMIFDGRYRHHYIAGPVGPGKFLPDRVLPKRVREKLLIKADGVEELACKLSMDPDALVATVTRYNRMASAGKDDDFGRGESLSDRYYGDDRIKPNPCMAPLSAPPYYAIPVYPGDLGTKGGLRIDTNARVLDDHDRPIAGLYAAGNTTASIMGRSYPGAGGTIGPALCFGFLAAEHAAQSTQAHAPTAPRAVAVSA